jgi:hypothetical protein
MDNRTILNDNELIINNYSNLMITGRLDIKLAKIKKNRQLIRLFLGFYIKCPNKCPNNVLINVLIKCPNKMEIR